MLKNIYMDAIFEGSNYVINQITGDAVSKGDIDNISNKFNETDISVVLGITGNINGKVIFTMGQPLAFKIASIIIGEDVKAIEDEIAKSCLAELGNMIMGFIATSFSKIGIDTNVTPPDIINENIESIASKNSEIACIPVVFKDGHIMNINTSIEIEAA